MILLKQSNWLNSHYTSDNYIDFTSKSSVSILFHNDFNIIPFK